MLENHCTMVPLCIDIKLCVVIMCSFLIDDNVGPEGAKMSKMFHVQPSSSALYPADKAQTIAITFRSDREVEIKDLAALKCQVRGLEATMSLTSCNQDKLIAMVLRALCYSRQ